MSDASFASSCEYLDAVEAVEGYLDRHLQKRSNDVSEYSPQLLESMRYSLFTPGKRFRPVLCQHTSLGLGGTGEFGQRLGAEFGDENTYLESVTRVTATIVAHIGLAMSYTVKNNSNVPPGAQGTDAYTTLTIQYTF